MGQSEYSKLKQNQSDAKKEDEKFKFRLIPNAKTFGIMASCTLFFGVLAFVFSKILKIRIASYITVAAASLGAFTLGVLLLLSSVTSIVWLLNKIRLKTKISRLASAESTNKREFEENYFRELEDKSIDKN